MEILKFTYKKVGFASWHIALGCLVAKFMYEELHDSLIFLNDATNSWLNTINPASHSFDWGIGFRF